MKLQKLLIGAAVLGAGSALFAQQIHIGGYVDYTSTAATQVFHKYPTEEKWEHTEVASEFGPVQNGIHFLNLDATAPNVDFHTNVWISMRIMMILLLRLDKCGFARTFLTISSDFIPAILLQTALTQAIFSRDMFWADRK